MKKRIAAACILLVISLATGITSLIMLKSSCDELYSALYELRSTAAEAQAAPDNAAEVNAAAVRASALWESKKTLFHVLTNHTELSEFETGITQLAFFAEKRDYGELIKLTESCLVNINHIKRSSELSISNVF